MQRELRAELPVYLPVSKEVPIIVAPGAIVTGVPVTANDVRSRSIDAPGDSFRVGEFAAQLRDVFQQYADFRR